MTNPPGYNTFNNISHKRTYYSNKFKKTHLHTYHPMKHTYNSFTYIYYETESVLRCLWPLSRKCARETPLLYEYYVQTVMHCTQQFLLSLFSLTHNVVVPLSYYYQYFLVCAPHIVSLSMNVSVIISMSIRGWRSSSILLIRVWLVVLRTRHSFALSPVLQLGTGSTPVFGKPLKFVIKKCVLLFPMKQDVYLWKSWM